MLFEIWGTVFIFAVMILDLPLWIGFLCKKNHRQIDKATICTRNKPYKQRVIGDLKNFLWVCCEGIFVGDVSLITGILGGIDDNSVTVVFRTKGLSNAGKSLSTKIILNLFTTE